MLLLSGGARAGAPAPLSAQDFLARVEKSHPSLPLLEAAVAQAEASVTVAGVWANPALSYDREEIFVAGRGQPENFMRLELPLEISGRRGLEVEGARLGLDAARKSASHDRAGLLLDALGVYWRAAAARQAVQLFQQERASVARLISAVRARTAAGDTSGYELDRLELEVGVLDDALADAEAEHERWRRTLGLLVGAPGTSFEAADPPGLPAAAASLEGLQARVLASRPDLQAARLRVSQAEREVAAAERGWVPDVVLSGGARNAVVSDSVAWGYVGGISLSVPVLDHGQGKLARARAQLSQAEASRSRLEQEVTAGLLLAHGTLEKLLAQAQRFEQQQPRLTRLVRRAELSFQEGERPVFELLDAWRTARTLRLRQVELTRQARLAELELARATGTKPGDHP
ncbi:MAG: TolC family protein [Archangium sp.]|nr:TolC family protein [Archangium sp.]